jgi:hypothetical protein
MSIEEFDHYNRDKSLDRSRRFCQTGAVAANCPDLKETALPVLADIERERAAAQGK